MCLGLAISNPFIVKAVGAALPTGGAKMTEHRVAVLAAGVMMPLGRRPFPHCINARLNGWRGQWEALAPASLPAGGQ